MKPVYSIYSVMIIVLLTVSCGRSDLYTEIQDRAFIKPSDLAGLEVWFAENIVFNSGTSAVEKWVDNVSGTSLDYTQSTFYPVVISEDGNRLIQFTASADLEFNGTWGKVINQPYTVFVVMRLTGICDAVFTGTGFNFYRGSGANTLFFDSGSALSWDAGSGVMDLEVYCFSVHNGSVDIYRDGNFQAQLNGIGTGSISALSFGGVNDHYFDIGEFIIYSRVLTDDERFKVTEYLCNRFY